MNKKTRILIDNLIQQNNALKEENQRLKKTFLCNCNTESAEIIRANLTISALRKALAEEKRKNELLFALK